MLDPFARGTSGLTSSLMLGRFAALVDVALTFVPGIGVGLALRPDALDCGERVAGFLLACSRVGVMTLPSFRGRYVQVQCLDPNDVIKYCADSPRP